jgi:hypothetical protein
MFLLGECEDIVYPLIFKESFKCAANVCAFILLVVTLALLVLYYFWHLVVSTLA